MWCSILRPTLEGYSGSGEEARLPIIADEIYSGIVFSGMEFAPMQVHSGDVPVLSLGGLAKEFVCPGWRVGWVTIHDRGGRLADIKTD